MARDALELALVTEALLGAVEETLQPHSVAPIMDSSPTRMPEQGDSWL